MSDDQWEKFWMYLAVLTIVVILMVAATTDKI
jgi:hypothetical protein